MNNLQQAGGGAGLGAVVKDGETSLLDQLAQELEQDINRLGHAVNRTSDNTNRLMGPPPPPSSDATKETTPTLAIDRIKRCCIHVEALTERLHETNNRLSRL